MNGQDLSKGECISEAIKYMRIILPKETKTITMANRGGGMCKFFVVGIFFRDYLGHEWFRDSYGNLAESTDYKKMLAEKKLLFPSYL